MSSAMKKKRLSALAKKLLLQYALASLGYVAGLFVLYLTAAQVAAQFVWYDTPLYRALKILQKTAVIWLGPVAAGGVLVITYRFLSKPLQYLDAVVAASERMLEAPEKAVTLPPQIKSVQDELNLVREGAFFSAMAAKEAEQRKNDLIVYLAHDLKTPLTSVIGYLSLLRDEPQISKELRAKYTGVALQKAERLEDLMNEFFEITRFNLTSLTLETETVNLTRMLEQTAFEFQPALARKKLEWDLRLPPGVTLLCDPDKLERVFDNLIRNAVYYSYPGSKVYLSLEDKGDLVSVQVKNHGKTIPPEKLGRIFEQFFRLDSSRASETGGAGLGLAIAKEIVELHGGGIEAQSENESIAFTVTLPRAVRKS